MARKADNVIEKSEAERRLDNALKRASELRMVINAEKLKGNDMAEIKLQALLLEYWKNGSLIMKDEDAHTIFNETVSKFRGKNISYAKTHLTKLFNETQGVGWAVEQKVKKTKGFGFTGAQAEVVNTIENQLAVTAK